MLNNNNNNNNNTNNNNNNENNKDNHQNSPQTIKLKVAVIGKSLVGKSAMTNVFIRSKFLEEYDTTIEDKYTVEKYISDKLCSIDILDTAGQDDFVSLIDTWINSSDGFILVFSITDRESFDNVKLKYNRIKINKGDDFKVILAGNKSDMSDNRVISNEEAIELAISWGSDYVECSAKNMTNVDKAFIKVSEKLLSKMFVDKKNDDNKKSKKSCFCF
jgi:small GTP-binding protein